MRGLVIYAFILAGLFYFSEGKPCPEKTRPHKTRCDSYYRCRQLPSNSHVWIPTKCNEGLVYEHNVGSCVLPGEDWECLSASELATTTRKPNDIIIVSDRNGAGLMLKESSAESHKHDDENVEIVLDGMLSSEEELEEDAEHHGKRPQSTAQPNDNESQISGINNFDSSGDGELVELDGFLQAENRESEQHMSNHKGQVQMLQAQLKQVTPSPSPTPESPIDPNLTAHLQRLSQLIDGLKQTYQNSDKPQTELRPDQLNAFLAHFDIKNRFDTMNPMDNYKAAPISSTTQAPLTTIKTTMPSSMSSQLPTPSPNKTRLQEHLSNHHMEPETKVVLSNGYGLMPGGSGSGYTNSQIVVNRPEGSVLFTLPHYGLMPDQQQQLPQEHMPHPHLNSHEYSNEPKISEETLKTVLELSKQMIAAQNLPKVLPNPAYNPAYYAPPILQPVILSPQGNPFQQYYAPQLQQQQQQQPPQYSQHKKHHHMSGASSNDYNKPSTTIIHNNVIPVHVSTTNSGEKEMMDSYGNSLGRFPSIPGADKHNNNNHLDNQNNNNYYNTNKFVASVTTARPTISVTTMATRYSGQYGAPYASEYGLTTPRPFEQQPSPATVANYYTPSPHLNDHNVNRVFQTESYPTMNVLSMPRPMETASSAGQRYPSHNLFPAPLEAGQVKIRPNSQKIESMEVEADEVINANANNNRHSSTGSNNNNMHHVLTYSSSSGGSGNMEPTSDLSEQLAPASVSSSYLEQNYGSQNAVSNHQYMPRPSTTSLSTSIYDNAGNLGVNVFSNSFASALPPISNNFSPVKPKFPPTLLRNGQHHNKQLVNFDGSFISLDVFQKSILPLLTRSPASLSELGKVEVITCQAGVRQPNVTDCTRYFVCSKKDGKVLSYSCPPYTGFNTQTRICDAQTYAQCGNLPLVSTYYSINENKRLQMEALKVLSEAKRRQEAALKAQNLVNLFQQYGSASNSQEQPSPASTSVEKDMLDSYMLNMPSVLSASTPRPALSASTSAPTFSPSSSSQKKRKYYCKEGDKIPDQTSIASYFVCYKNAQGQMKGHKMTCSKGLLFCPKTLMCTLASKCD
ncbi:transcription factor mef2A [Scaptodrosophila lebanonensis]|uniref:Transcription factor mef2A n=1 Tax=Drosophila lebanonensis TaxID=7225 RepID=A0A6J2U6W3_DROLE|nr:transcription factor mef2A [Scaptodrosophila lebanonensis]